MLGSERPSFLQDRFPGSNSNMVAWSRVQFLHSSSSGHDLVSPITVVLVLGSACLGFARCMSPVIKSHTVAQLCTLSLSYDCGILFPQVSMCIVSLTSSSPCVVTLTPSSLLVVPFGLTSPTANATTCMELPCIKC